MEEVLPGIPQANLYKRIKTLNREQGSLAVAGQLLDPQKGPEREPEDLLEGVAGDFDDLEEAKCVYR